MKMKKYIAYRRVSTDKQGVRGLGMEDQDRAIKDYCKDGEIIAEFIEAKSAERTKKRPQFDLAIEMAKKTGATMVMINLERSSRSVSTIFQLRECPGLNIKYLDMPDNPDTLTIGMKAVFAQYERERISERTKAALSVLIARGVKLGPKNLKAKQHNMDLIPLITHLYEQKMSLSAIAKELNERGYITTRGKSFGKSQVQYLLEMAPKELEAA